MDSLISEQPAQIVTEPKPQRSKSFTAVAPKPQPIVETAETVKPAALHMPTPHVASALPKEAKPRLAAQSAVGVTGRGVAIAAGITAVPVAIKFLVRPKSKARKIALSIATSMTASLPWNYLFNVRPTMLYWGATVAEVKQPLPGDELVPEPQMETTYAITINAPPAQVWPWLVQIGQGRGGLYSYEALENLTHLEMHNADHIIPELQNLKVGDKIRLTPTESLALEVATLKPERALVLCNPNLRAGKGKVGNYFKVEMNVSWAFVLEPIGRQATRLIVRWHMDYLPNLPTALAIHLMQEPAQFIMQRKMMLGIKERAEKLYKGLVG